MPKKLIKCVKDVKKKSKGKKKVNPYAICVKSTGMKPHKKKKNNT